MLLARSSDFSGSRLVLGKISENDMVELLDPPFNFTYEEFLSGSAKSLTMLDQSIANIKVRLPRFKIVILDETDKWTASAYITEAGKIWTAYLYDEERKVSRTATRPSYELQFLYSTAENIVTNERLTQERSSGAHYISACCQDIDTISWQQKYYCGHPRNEHAQSYKAMQQAQHEHYLANVCLATPRTPCVHMLVEAAHQQYKDGDFMAAVATVNIAAKLDLQLKAMKQLKAAAKCLKFGPFNKVTMDRVFESILLITP